MARFETAHLTVAYRKHCEDCVAVIHHEERSILVVADGAGGMGGGALAAATVTREVEKDHLELATAESWEAELRQIDCRIGTGESTAVVVDLRPDSLVGASVGDSRAWIIHDGELLELSRDQIRKPLLGSGRAEPRGFSHGPLEGILLVATDGFANYVKRELLGPMIAQTDFLEIPRKCVEMVRLPSGDLWDDIGIVACRIRRPSQTRQKYAI